MTDITSLLSLQARARRNARDQLVLVRQLRRDRALAERELLAHDPRGGTPAQRVSSGTRRI